MKIKIDCRILSEQIQLLEMYAGVISSKHNKELVEGILNILSEVMWAVEEDEDLRFERVN
jgi:hypothetical protein